MDRKTGTFIQTTEWGVQKVQNRTGYETLGTDRQEQWETKKIVKYEIRTRSSYNHNKGEVRGVSCSPIWVTRERQGTVTRGPVCCFREEMTQQAHGSKCTLNSLIQAEEERREKRKRGEGERGGRGGRYAEIGGKWRQKWEWNEGQKRE